ncbi:MAG TPA: pyruvate synthase [bacterium (Candidatus Stahlbacteria)]|nr:pyruvate synthase [Candidatus Stahlbacteria bacterium]
MKRGWKNLPIGALIERGGTATEFKTGDWRTDRPIWDKDKCTACLFCFIYCPDSSIIVEDGKMIGIDLDFCKGCGICKEVCPKGAIEMRREADFR